MRPIQTSKQIEIPYLLKIGKGKLNKLGKYLYDKEIKTIALFYGEGIKELFGEQISLTLSNFDIHVLFEYIVSTTDIDEINHTAFFMPNVTAIIGIGGGKSLDFAKYTAHILKLPFISIPTAISNDSFGSPSCSLTIQGKRKSVKAGSPYGVVIDLDIIKNSPDVFLYSGIGDMVSKITALKDWQKARDLGLDRYVDFASMLAYNSMDILLLKYSYDIRDESFQASLATSLMMSGLAMEIAGSSRPASGSEHLISHALDEVAKNPKMHGIQVGVATYLCALLQGNSHCSNIKEVLTKTGFYDSVKNDPFEFNEFKEALRLAPTIKSNFYSVLSESSSYDRAISYLKEDDFLNSLIV